MQVVLSYSLHVEKDKVDACGPIMYAHTDNHSGSRTDLSGRKTVGRTQ